MIEKKNKKAITFLTGHTLNIIIAIMALLILSYLGYKVFDLFQDNEDAKKEVITKINKFKLDPEDQKKLIKEREKNNIELFIDKMLWWFITLIIMVLLNIAYIIFYKVEFSKPDLMLVLFVLSAFASLL